MMYPSIKLLLAGIFTAITFLLSGCTTAYYGGCYGAYPSVRNPLARLYSCYRDKVVNAETRRSHCTLTPYGINFGMSFDEFVYRVAEIPDPKANDHFRSLHTFLTYKGHSFVDYVGKLENFNEEC